MDFKMTEEQELMVQAITDAMTRENLESYFQDCDKNNGQLRREEASIAAR